MNSTSYHLLYLVNKDGNKLYKIILFILDGHSETFRGGAMAPMAPPLGTPLTQIKPRLLIRN